MEIDDLLREWLGLAKEEHADRRRILEEAEMLANELRHLVNLLDRGDALQILASICGGGTSR